MDARRASLLGSLSRKFQGNGGAIINPTISQRDNNATPKDHVRITVDLCGCHKVHLTVHQTATVEMLKTQLLNDFFIPSESVLVPPSLDDMHLFLQVHNNHNHKQPNRPSWPLTKQEFSWEDGGNGNKIFRRRNSVESTTSATGATRIELQQQSGESISAILQNHGLLNHHHKAVMMMLQFPVILKVKTNGNQPSVLQVPLIVDNKEDDQVSTIKQALRQHTNTIQQPQRLQLLWNGKELEDYHRFFKLLFHNSNTIEHNHNPHSLVLELHIHEWMVHIRTLQGQTFSMGLDADSAISSLQEKAKKLIESSCSKKERPYVSDTHPNMSLDDYRLVLANGKTLDLISSSTTSGSDTTACQDIGISNESTIYLVLKMYDRPLSMEDKPRCTIPKTEHRGITILQLRELATRMLLQCSGWKSTNPQHQDGQFLLPEQVTLYDLMHHYVKPLTSASACSYVELVATQEQIPTVFTRELPVADPKATPFFKAMQLTNGTLSILDSGAVYFSRIWCVFELHMVMNDLRRQGKDKKEPYFHDIYTVARDDNGTAREPSGVLDHIVPCNERFRRLASFPLHTCHAALALKLEQAVATVEQDRTFILNCIIGEKANNLYKEARACHEKYDQLNAMLHARIAEATYCTALQNGGNELGVFRHAFGASSHGQLLIYVRGCQPFRYDAKALIAALPNTLVGLELDIGFIDFESSEEFSSGLNAFLGLRRLKLVASWCQHLTQCNQLWTALEELLQLEELCLDLSCCKRLASIDGLGGQVLPKLQHLKSLDLSVADCESLILCQTFWDGLARAHNLVKCDLDFSYTPLTAVASLGAALGNMSQLQTLSLKLDDCNLNTIDPIVSGFSQTTGLSTLRIRLSGNRMLSSLEELAKALASLVALEYLELDCSYCNALKSVNLLQRTLESCSFPRLLDLRLMCKRNKYLESPNVPAISPERMPRLKVLHLDFSHCPGVASVAGLAQGFGSVFLHSWESLLLDFQGTAVSGGNALEICKALRGSASSSAACKPELSFNSFKVTSWDELLAKRLTDEEQR
ncbi:expressed unknown protein [Seminavis robusta]|uniref:Ubiquitin-like domain-containing protein n=1 Tax=Seminavis robusta TaxID=568900 RepID=A0A9N8DSW3_9STRA|nr:expressed unknown protein [Seminavis robusta]|eukprot:Sro228_g092570.1 n/a (1041) ;mRNA; f:16714-20044